MSVYHKDDASALDAALRSVLLDQTVLPAEIILVEDGPLTDSLDQVIKKYKEIFPNFKSLKFERNQGLGTALREGLMLCSHDWIARMDSDDVSKPHRFEKQLEVISKYPDVDVVGSWIDEFCEITDNITSVKRVPEHHREIYTSAKKRSPVNHPTVFLRKSAVLAAGNYQAFPLFEDYFLWIRMLKNGAGFYNIQESLLFFRMSPETFKRRGGKTYARNERKLQRKFKQSGFINTFEMYRNITIRTGFRLIPNCCREVLYKKLLRK